MTLRSLYDLPAPAKLNLFLHVVGRRADGYHLLQSPFVLIDWADTLHFERRDDGRLQRHDLGPALPADDLCLRAARLLQAESGCTLGADISIDKQVPWGAGMGGGSSDAATTLLALNRLWGLHWPRARLLALGARLGADVPFFIGGQQRLRRRHRRAADAGTAAAPVVRGRQAAAAIATAEIFAHPLAATRHRKRYSHGLSCRGSGTEAVLHRLRPQRPAGCGRKQMSRGGASRPLAGGSFRQQPHDGLGQRGVRKSRHR